MRFLIGAALLATLVPASADQTSMLAGIWYSEGVENGHYGQLIDHRNADGTFWLDARQLDQKDCHLIKAWREAGTWRVENGVVLQTTSTVEAMPTDYHDTYKILSLTNNEFIWFDPDTQIKWVSTRLGNSEFPSPGDCNTVS